MNSRGARDNFGEKTSLESLSDKENSFRGAHIPDRSHGYNQETMDRSAEYSQETMDRSAGYRQETMDRSAGYSQETMDRSAVYSQETMDRSAGYNQETMDRSAGYGQDVNKREYSSREIRDTSSVKTQLNSVSNIHSAVISSGSNSAVNLGSLPANSPVSTRDGSVSTRDSSVNCSIPGSGRAGVGEKLLE